MTLHTAEEFWAGRCLACAHSEHLLARCPEIVGSFGGPMPEPDYCPCADQMPAMETEIRRLRALVSA